VHVEVADSVFGFLAEHCTDDEQDAFLELCKRWEADATVVGRESLPFRASVAPGIFRWFSFGRCVAVFELDGENERIRILVGARS
jgi:hypothetical protein